jgi:flagellar basal-body rod protein FlgG
MYNLIEGSLTQQLRFDAVSNNLANVNSNGFKQDTLSFEMALTMKNKTAIDFSPGPVVHTGNPLDIALDGSGFFKVQTKAGIRYSRDGALGINNEGVLVNKSGDAVLGQNGPVRLNGGEISIGPDGQISENGAPGEKLMIADFRDIKLLRKEGRSYFVYGGKDQDVIPAGKVSLRQNYIEKSNVNPTEEMIKMIESFRAFESVQKAIQNMDEIVSKMVNDPDLL